VYDNGEQLTCDYRADFICHDRVIVECSAQQTVTHVNHAQLINYLKATRNGVGLLLKFGATSLGFERFALSESAKSA